MALTKVRQEQGVVINEGSTDVDLRVESNGNANMLFVDGGNDKIGINNGSPARQLHITDTIANGGASLGLTSSDSSTTGAMGILHFGNNTDSSLASIGAIADGSTSAGALLFKTEVAGGAIEERMRINSTGGLITTPAAGGHAVFNEGSIDADFRVESNGNDHMIFVDGGSNVVNIGHATNTVGTSSGTLMVGFAGNTANGIKLRDSRGESGTNNAIVFVRGDAAAGAITTTTAPATQYTTASDERLKENIADADDASSKIDTIKVRKFDWKNNGSHQDYGLIAQELRPIAPDAVAGDADSENMMSVDYAKLVPMMIKEIQSLRLRLKTLEENK